MPRRYRLRSRSRRRSKFPRRRFVGRGRASFRRKVKSVLYKTAELKQVANPLNQEVLVSGDTTRWSLCPAVSQGPGDNQRIGNTIMSRNFQIKVWLGAGGNNAALTLIRIFLVWPRKFSRADAIAGITSTTFPLFGMIDQDNWIVWMDKSIQLTAQPNLNPTINQIYRFEYNKRFYSKIEYRASGDTLPNKAPWMVIIHNSNAANSLTINGYFKMSYKDI